MTLHIPDIAGDMDTLSAALAYAAAGWYVLPTDPKIDGKHPGSVVGKGWPAKSSRDPKVIAGWFAGTAYGIALHCGRSGVAVFDVDRPGNVPGVLADHLAGAAHQSSRPDQPGRGHYLFRQPEGRSIGNSTGKLGGAWGEVRGRNGVIIAAPTPHPNGGCYTWQRRRLDVLPAALADLLPDSHDREDTATDAQVQAFLAAHTKAARPQLVKGKVGGLLAKIEKGESRHGSTVPFLTGALEEARCGYYTAQAAVDAIRPVFVNAVQMGENRRTGAEAADEFAGILAWAVAQANARSLDEVRARVESLSGATDPGETAGAPAAAPATLPEAHAVFRRWLGEDYDTDSLDAMLATLAVERFTDGSDPLWTLIVGGPGNAKTETVQAGAGIGAVITSSLSSEAALLSATPKRERSKQATGGLLRKVGDRGVLVIKDVTSILSMNRDLRARVLAALREVYDGSWYREVGTDGGLTIPWHGRIAVVGAVTTAWDTAHAVISSMGDRFVLVRLDSTEGRQRAGRKAISNTGSETTMRAELAAAVAGVLAGMDTEPVTVTGAETDALLAAADLVTLARTAVEYDYRGDVIDAHAPEMPTRFAKQLTQIVRGAVAVGIDRHRALKLAVRCARDSMPPLRLAIIEDLADHPNSPTGDIRRRIDKPRSTVDRQLQALHILGVLTVTEAAYGDGRISWRYSLAEGIDPSALDPESLPEMSLTTPSPSGRESGQENSPALGSDKSGEPEQHSGPLAHCRVCGAVLPPHMRSQVARGYCSDPECIAAARTVSV